MVTFKKGIGMVKPRPLHKKNGLLLAEMTRRGYTIQTLAEKVGVHYLTIWRIVNQAHNPSKKTATKISNVLEVDVERIGLSVWGLGSEKGRTVDQGGDRCDTP